VELGFQDGRVSANDESLQTVNGRLADKIAEVEELVRAEQ
jgi:hypothetical protein